MRIFSSIGDGFNAVASGFNSLCQKVGSIGNAVSNFAANIKPVLGPILTTIEALVPHPMVKAVVSFANKLLHVLSIFNANENVTDMGDRALQAAEKGITMDGYDSFDEYMAALRDFEIDPKESEKFSPAEKLIAGLGVATAGIESKFDLAPGSVDKLWILPLVNPGYFSVERIKAILESGNALGDISSYLEKTMGGEEASEFFENYEVTPEGKEMNDEEFYELRDAFDAASKEWASLKKDLDVGRAGNGGAGNQ